MTQEQFVLNAITSLRREDQTGLYGDQRGLKGQQYGKFYGIPLDGSGLAAAFQEYFHKNPKPVLERLEREGQIVIRRVLKQPRHRLGRKETAADYRWTIYDPKYLPPSWADKVEQKPTKQSLALDKILSAAKK